MPEKQDYLANVDPMSFMGLLSMRKEKIDAGETKPLPGTYTVNEKAKTLHPKEQYLIISKVTQHGSDAKSFELIPNTAEGTKGCAYFRAGQYISVLLDIDRAKVSRPYSIRSGQKDALNGKYILTIKGTENGYASKYILDNWKAGMEVETSGPEGNFYYEPLRDAKHVVGIAGGSGITPFYSLACAIADGIEDCNLTLLYGSRTKDNILLKEEFDRLEANCSKIKVIHVLCDELDNECEIGFITAGLIKKYAPADDYSIFLCGPQAMYDFVDKEIETLGLPIRRIRHELFGEYKNPEKEADYPKDAVGKKYKLTVTVRGDKQAITCASSDTLLVAMERAGITAPSRCRSGECGYCHSRLVSGRVYIPKFVDGRRMADFKFGYVHPCCTFPLGDVEIDVPAK